MIGLDHTEFHEHLKQINALILKCRSLTTGPDLDDLQQLLVVAAPRWCSQLRVWMGRRDQRTIDLKRPGALAEALRSAAAERGPTYRALVDSLLGWLLPSLGLSALRMGSRRLIARCNTAFFRLERPAGWDFHPLESAALPRRTPI